MRKERRRRVRRRRARRRRVRSTRRVRRTRGRAAASGSEGSSTAQMMMGRLDTFLLVSTIQSCHGWDSSILCVLWMVCELCKQFLRDVLEIRGALV